MAVYNYIVPTGLVEVDTGFINTQVQDEYKATFGLDLVVTPNTPQGLLITSETLARRAVADNNAALANQINPNIAGGIFLDAIMALTGSFRSAAIPNFLTATLNGVPGTIIPAGAQASDTAFNNTYFLTATVTIPAGGAVTGVTFQAVQDGVLPFTNGTLTNILTQVLGWETITDSALTSQGAATQSDVQAREFRRRTLASQGTSLSEAITSACFNVDGVTSLAFIENIASTTEVLYGVTMVSHSIYVCINGGESEDIAYALTNSKSAGASYNNSFGVNEAVTILVPFSNQSLTALFDRPNLIDIYVNMTVEILIPLQTPVANLKQAILNYVAGNVNNVQGLGVGINVSPFEISAAVGIQYPGVYIQDCEISLTSGSGFAAEEILINKWEIANILEGFIDITVSL